MRYLDLLVPNFPTHTIYILVLSPHRLMYHQMCCTKWHEGNLLWGNVKAKNWDSGEVASMMLVADMHTLADIWLLAELLVTFFIAISLSFHHNRRSSASLAFCKYL